MELRKEKRNSRLSPRGSLNGAEQEIPLDSLKKQLEKGNKSCLLKIKNGTSLNLVLDANQTKLAHGKFIKDADADLPSGYLRVTAIISKSMMGGVEGQIVYHPEGQPQNLITLLFGNATKKYTKFNAPKGFQINSQGTVEKHAEITFTITQMDQPEAHVQTPLSSTVESPESNTEDNQIDEEGDQNLAFKFNNDDNAWSDDEEDNAPKFKVVIKDANSAPKPDANTDDLWYAIKGFQIGSTTPLNSRNLRRQKTTKSQDPDSLIALSTSFVCEGITKLEMGDFSSALSSFSSAVTHFASLPEPIQNSKAKEIRITASYRILAKLLLEMKQYPDNAVEVLEALTAMKSILPSLQPAHRLIVMRMHIKENIKAGNYGVARDLLNILLSLHLKDHNDLLAKLAECEKNGFTDKNLPKGSITVNRSGLSLSLY